MEESIRDSSGASAATLAEAHYAGSSQRICIRVPKHRGRPVYYWAGGGGDFVASTHAAMLKRAGVPLCERGDVLPEFIVYRYVMPPRTLLKDIYRLPFGGELRAPIGAGGIRTLSLDTYDPPKPTRKGSRAGAAVRRDVLRYLREVTSVPESDRLALLLSGGLDSSILFRVCEQRYGKPHTYSTSYPFEEPNRDREREYARTAAEAFGSEHRHHETSNAAFVRGVVEAIAAAEEPVHHLQSVLLHLLFRDGLPSERDVVVVGQGADGVFGLGLHNRLYRRRRLSLRLLSRKPCLALLERASHWFGRGQGLVAELHAMRTELPLSHVDHPVWSLGAFGDRDWVCDRFGVEPQSIIRGRMAAIQPYIDRSMFDQVSILDLFGDVAMTIQIWSKLAEACGRAVVYPYTYRPLLDEAFTLSWDAKLQRPKNILRGLARELGIPRFIIERPKSGFGIRPERWAGRGGVLDPLRSLVSSVVDEKELLGLQQHEPKKAMTFWNLLNFGLWKRLIIDGDTVATVLDEVGGALRQRQQHRASASP